MDRSPRTTLNRISDDLFLTDHSGDLRQAAIELHSLLAEITGVHDNSELAADHQATQLESGKAISPKDAARCVLDFARTTKFLRGAHAAILALQKRFPNQQFELLYAGCGPFAPLALPLAAKFDAEQVQITLLDIHERSLQSAAELFRVFNLQDRVRAAVQADASTYTHDCPPHMIIVETMQRALTVEPQVANTLNLFPQLAEGGVFLPERVRVDAFLFDPAREFSFVEPDTAGAQQTRLRIHLGSVFELPSSFHDQSGPAKTVRIPHSVPEGAALLLATTIKVFESLTLDEYESGITYPLILENLTEAHAGRAVEFQYSLQLPGFRHSWLS